MAQLILIIRLLAVGFWYLYSQTGCNSKRRNCKVVWLQANAEEDGISLTAANVLQCERCLNSRSRCTITTNIQSA
jgi:hypothetical protein